MSPSRPHQQRSAGLQTHGHAGPHKTPIVKPKHQADSCTTCMCAWADILLCGEQHNCCSAAELAGLQQHVFVCDRAFAKCNPAPQSTPECTSQSVTTLCSAAQMHAGWSPGAADARAPEIGRSSPISLLIWARRRAADSAVQRAASSPCAQNRGRGWRRGCVSVGTLWVLGA